MTCVKILSALAMLGCSQAADPVRPHLAQAWTALSEGDGLPGQIGLEHYIYEENKTDKYALQAHVWDYGPSCKKIELNTPHGFLGWDSDYIWGTYYIKCDAVDCCFGGTTHQPQRPDVKQWDIHTPGPLGKIKVKWMGYNDTTELNDNPVKHSEKWHEEDSLFMPKPITYDYFITRNTADIISHRIDYTAPSVAPGSILYGNFTVQHNVTSFREMFKIPSECRAQGRGGHALWCGKERVAMLEKKYFKHSYATRFVQREVVV